MSPQSYWVETLGCPKNEVDSAKLIGTLEADGYAPADSAADADVVVVNTCAFIEAARQESIDTVLALSGAKRANAKLVVTGCMAERYGAELADALPEVDQVAGFGVPIALGKKKLPAFDLLNLPRPKSPRPWAYVKVAEGCDRNCGFCAIPSFRGKQRSRARASVLEEVDSLGAREIVLVAQDLASYGNDIDDRRAIVPLVEQVAQRVERVRLLYLYPSDLTDGLIDAIGATGVAYFDLSLQHSSAPLVKRMRRWGNGEKFLARIDDIRRRFPDATIRSNFIVGYPGETEADHDNLLAFMQAAQFDWVGLFAYSREEGTFADRQDGHVDPSLVKQRLAEADELQDGITRARRAAHVGTTQHVLIDEPGVARSQREAPEIDGVVRVPEDLPVGTFHTVRVTGVEGVDLEAVLA
ncbi:MAG TPA: 30S ribosomal protein S12 methylthiotransferase RimO [Acidimicrobiales bacterium]|nr:30S ribosomal protein S12 methylthiotransferase RimO [Acidimicrobiales bacterium]